MKYGRRKFTRVLFPGNRPPHRILDLFVAGFEFEPFGFGNRAFSQCATDVRAFNCRPCSLVRQLKRGGFGASARSGFRVCDGIVSCYLCGLLWWEFRMMAACGFRNCNWYDYCFCGLSYLRNYNVGLGEMFVWLDWVYIHIKNIYYNPVFFELKKDLLKFSDYDHKKFRLKYKDLLIFAP